METEPFFCGDEGCDVAERSKDALAAASEFNENALVADDAGESQVGVGVKLVSRYQSSRCRLGCDEERAHATPEAAWFQTTRTG